jgi:hypothetical protein
MPRRRDDSVGALCDRRVMDEVLMLRGLVGLCPDCRDERILLPVDDSGFELCCTDCDAAVLLVETGGPVAVGVRLSA